LMRSQLLKNRVTKVGNMVIVVSGAPTTPVGQTGLVQVVDF